MHEQQNLVSKSSLDGLWVLLIDGQVEGPKVEGRVPVIARTGDDQTYVLGFKNMQKARKFMTDSLIDNAEPRLVVRSNREDFLNVAKANNVAGVLVDYDPRTHEYSTAAELY